MIQIGDVFALASTQEEKYEAEITEQPVESGSNFADNQINKALVITRECVISATPLGENLNAKFGPNIVAGCKARLIALRDTKEPFTVVEPDMSYPNMTVESVVFSRTIKTGNALAFKIQLKQITIVTNDRQVIDVALPRAQDVKKRGDKTSKEPDPPPAEDKRSRLRRVANYFGFKNTKPNPGGGL